MIEATDSKLASEAVPMSTAVEVSGNTVEVVATEQPAGVWIAAGRYLGKQIEVKGDSCASAVSLWQRTAEYRGS